MYFFPDEYNFSLLNVLSNSARVYVCLNRCSYAPAVRTLSETPVLLFKTMIHLTSWHLYRQVLYVQYTKTVQGISIGNSMICSDIWHKYHEWYFEIVIRNLRQFWNIASGIYAKYHLQIMLLFVYTTTRKGFVIFTCRYFKLSWNTTALSQSNCRNFSCSSIIC